VVDEDDTMPAEGTAKVVHELIDELAKLDAKFEGLDEPSTLEGYKWIFSILQVGLDAFVWADTGRPRFVDIVGPYKKWGGDNPDAFYQYAPIDPSRSYVVRGKRGDAVYLSLTVYGGPNDGRYSERIVGTINDRDLTFDADGNFELTLGPEARDGAHIKLEPDAVCAITRDYIVEPDVGRRTEFRIDATDPPATRTETDEDLARRFRATLTWLRDQANIVPLSLDNPNTIDPPYPVPQQTFGWAAGDAAYAMGRFDLKDGQALELRGRSPDCAFWNLVLWNPFLHSYDYAYERVGINGEQVKYEDDGSWTIVIAKQDPGHPNWVSTQGHDRGLIWFRWFLPAETPDPIAVRVVGTPAQRGT
jgi:hypothetical protein